MKNGRNHITVSFDRTVYPLNSIMHIRVNISHITHGKQIAIGIYNSRKKLIVPKKINPFISRNLAKNQGFIYQVSIPMKGKGWKIGESYTVIARYGTSESNDSMVIAKRRPSVQTDKSVYIRGSDIIVTVIAPDLDRDNQKPEIIGNMPEHRLTISSSKSTLTNYKLLETGDSTGIFQGVIRLTPGRYVNNGKEKIWKSSGLGPFNGILAAGEADIIKIKFQSKSGTETDKVYVSNFGATIELDKKVYVPTDKVYITVVAPDYNFDSEKIDAIGNRFDNEIAISTSEGKLSNYKLIETGSDTGIFIGEITLTGSQKIIGMNKRRLGKTKGSGPINGQLACSKNDKLLVTFTTKSKIYKASALAKFNMGDIHWDKDSYSKNSSAKIRIVDPDMNLNPNEKDHFKIKVWSNSDLIGLELEVYETGEETGVFEAKVILSNDTSSLRNKLKVSSYDSIFAKYIDWTLPASYSRYKNLEIIAAAKVGTAPKPISIVKILKDSAIPHDGKYLNPETLAINVGGKVQWVNEDSAAHTITSGTPDEGPTGQFDSSLFMFYLHFSNRPNHFFITF